MLNIIQFMQHPSLLKPETWMHLKVLSSLSSAKFSLLKSNMFSPWESTPSKLPHDTGNQPNLASLVRLWPRQLSIDDTPVIFQWIFQARLLVFSRGLTNRQVLLGKKSHKRRRKRKEQTKSSTKDEHPRWTLKTLVTKKGSLTHYSDSVHLPPNSFISRFVISWSKHKQGSNHTSQSQ